MPKHHPIGEHNDIFLLHQYFDFDWSIQSVDSWQIKYFIFFYTRRDRNQKKIHRLSPVFSIFHARQSKWSFIILLYLSFYSGIFIKCPHCIFLLICLIKVSFCFKKKCSQNDRKSTNLTGPRPRACFEHQVPDLFCLIRDTCNGILKF